MKYLFLSILFAMTLIEHAGAQESKLFYLTSEPKVATAKAPLLILLHGVGSNEQDLYSLAAQFPAEYRIIFARAPITLGTDSYAWYQVDFSSGKPVINDAQERSSRVILTDFVKQMRAKYAAAGNEVYLGGFSQGAIMSYSVALTHPELVSGVVALSGRLLEEVKPAAAPKAKLAKLRVFIGHGTGDTMLPVDYARQSKKYLETSGLNVTLKEYPCAHTIVQEELADLLKWLKEK